MMYINNTRCHQVKPTICCGRPATNPTLHLCLALLLPWVAAHALPQQAVSLQRQDQTTIAVMAYAPKAGACRGAALVSPGAGGSETGSLTSTPPCRRPDASGWPRSTAPNTNRSEGLVCAEFAIFVIANDSIVTGVNGSFDIGLPLTLKLPSMHPAIAQHRADISAICKRYRIRRLEVFGSAARTDDFDVEHSDADFLVQYETPMCWPASTETGNPFMQRFFS